MSLADEITQIPTDTACCTTGKWYAQQDEKTRAAFDAFVADVIAGRRKKYQPLWEVCCRHGLEISSRSFRDHLTVHHQVAKP